MNEIETLGVTVLEPGAWVAPSAMVPWARTVRSVNGSTVVEVPAQAKAKASRLLATSFE
jgi:hypothetical protein